MADTKLSSRLAGVPTGGGLGQVLKKLSNDDYDYAWANDATSSTVLPPGSIQDFATFMLPSGFLAANGDLYEYSIYNDLGTAVGLLHCISFFVSDKPNSILKYDKTKKPWLNVLDTGGQVVAVPVRIAIYEGTYPNATSPTVDYWLRYSAYPLSTDPSFTLHATQADALANTGKIAFTDNYATDRTISVIEKSGYFRVPNYLYDGGLFRRAYSGTGTRQLGSYKQDMFESHNHSIPARFTPSTGSGGNLLSQGSGINTGSTGGDETVPMHASVLVGIKT